MRGRDRDSGRGERKRSKSPEPSAAPPRQKKRSLWDIPPGVSFSDQPEAPIIPGTNPHQVRQAKRLYVGNIPPGITEGELSDFFNTAMYAAGVTKDGARDPVVSVHFNREKGFAFLDFNHPEDSTAGMAFDGITLHAYSLKVARPRDYKDIDEAGAEPDTSNQLIISNLPPHLTDDQVKELLQTLGQLKSFIPSRGSATFEYAEAYALERALKELNGTRVGDRNVSVQKLSSVKPGPDGALFANITALNFLNLQMPIAAAANLVNMDVNVSDLNPTRILQLMNLASLTELQDDEEYDGILKDVESEVRRYGKVLSVFMVKPPPADPEGRLPDEHIWCLGRAFVEYSNVTEAQNAHAALGGRKFNCRSVVTGYYSEEAFNVQQFRPNLDVERKYADEFIQVQQKKLLEKKKEKGFH